MASVAENFQLKWHSFGSHLHASVATLLHSETFADVVLSTADGRHVSAHRFVLAACSSYLQGLLGAGSLAANGHLPIIVILPSEISHRTLCVLVKYMYSGEATVSHAQLDAVLRAGDILRIRGLYRPPREKEHPKEHVPPRETHHLLRALDGYSRRKEPYTQQPAAAVVHSGRHFMDPTRHHYNKQSHRPSQTANSSSSQSPAATTTTTTTSSSRALNGKHRRESRERQIREKRIRQQKERDNNKESRSEDKTNEEEPQVTAVKSSGSIAGDEIMEPDSPRPETPTTEDQQTAPNRQDRLSTSSKPEEEAKHHRQIRDRDKADSDESSPPPASDRHNGEASNRLDEERTCESPPPSGIDGSIANLVEMKIKEEPIEWDVESEIQEAMMDELPNMQVKPEVDDMEPREGELMYSPLTCDYCQQTFLSPAEWVRHIENHSEMRRAPRRRGTKRQSSESVESDRGSRAGGPGCSGTSTTSSSSSSAQGQLGGQSCSGFPQLVCDVCAEPFGSPGAWVRHIQTHHTDEELAEHNQLGKTTPPVSKVQRQFSLKCLSKLRRIPLVSRSSSHPCDSSSKACWKRCPVCTKSFPSQASVIIHRRTHTGEKPYVCPTCNKGFNVKSNLLRHLRTLHDQVDSPGSSVLDNT